MGFRFRLAKVLSHRRRQVDAAARHLAAATVAYAAAQQGAVAAAKAVDSFVEAVARARVEALDPRRLAQELAYREVLEQRRTQARHAASAAHDAMESARALLVEAHREQEVLERLEARQREAWEQAQQRLDLRRMDEVGSLRAAAATRQDKPGSQA